MLFSLCKHDLSTQQTCVAQKSQSDSSSTGTLKFIQLMLGFMQSEVAVEKAREVEKLDIRWGGKDLPKFMPTFCHHGYQHTMWQAVIPEFTGFKTRVLTHTVSWEAYQLSCSCTVPSVGTVGGSSRKLEPDSAELIKNSPHRWKKKKDHWQARQSCCFNVATISYPSKHIFSKHGNGAVLVIL